jgi:type IV fimbrial biogenesis protein FimT
MAMRARGARGFTLPEAMLALLVLSILVTLALPMLGQMVMTHRVRSASFELLSTLNYARSEAIKRNDTVAVTAAGPGWESGWQVTEPGGAVVKLQPQLTAGLRITGPGTVTYERDGRLPQTGASAIFSVRVEPPREGVEGRCVRIDLTGRVSSRRGAC